MPEQLSLTDKEGGSVNVEVLGIDSISRDIAEVNWIELHLSLTRLSYQH